MAECVFSDLQLAPPIEVFQLNDLFNKSECKDKVNLGVGAYRTDDAKPWVLPVVAQVEKQMASDQTLNHEYLPVAGLPLFRDLATKLLLGDDHKAVKEGRTAGFQALGGTGALRLAAAFLKSVLNYDTVYVSNPTWGNHKGVFKSAGFSSIKEYRYFESSSCSLDLDGMLEDLSNAPPKSVIILHAVAHNPTGVDPTPEQWEKIYKTIVSKNLFVLMDCAYQGFASGNLEKDAFASRFFANKDIDMLIAQSFSKNFGLYNERTGNLIVVSKDGNKMNEIQSQMAIQIRTLWSNPPNHGARIVATVLNNPEMFSLWNQHIEVMANRIIHMRQLLLKNLKELDTPGTWTHIVNQIGMFSYTGLTEKQVEHMKSKYHIFLLKSGRISMCGLTTKNVEYVAKAMDEAVRTYPSN